MKTSEIAAPVLHDAAGPACAQSAVAPKEPPLWVVLLIFWGAIAMAIAVAAVINPDMFVRMDPDSLMRLVQVRDLVAGQSWFDLTQHRMDPPTGSLLHWSRLIDAPVAALIVVGDFVGLGEDLALIAWPLFLLLGLMAGVMLSAVSLAGRRAAVPALLLSLVFLDPLIFFFPGDIDHHNAQYALTALMLAVALRLGGDPRAGILLGFGTALMLAIGMEMAPYVAVFGAVVALRWAFGHVATATAAAFGLAFALAPAALHLATGSPQARYACDALSLAFAFPAAVAGFGLAVVVLALGRVSAVTIRLAGLGALAAASGATLMAIAPECLAGPYGKLSAELKTVWLDTVLEALPITEYAARRPVAAIAALGPPTVALAVVLAQIWRGPAERRIVWATPLVVLATALALSFYQVRTLPYANVAAIAVLGAWLGTLAARYDVTTLRSRAAAPMLAGFLVACPLVHLALGAAAVDALSRLTDGRVAPPERPTAALADGLSNAERECLDPASAAFLASVPRGQVLSPVFYGPAVLLQSPHDVVAAPYHRSGRAILDATYAIQRPPEGLRAILERRDVDYVAICSTSRESAVSVDKAPDGLLALLLSGQAVDGLEPVAAADGTTLKLWRVSKRDGYADLRGPQP